MDIVSTIVIPIIASLLGGVVGGLFTFLGVKMTISNEQKIREADLKLHKEELRQKEIEKNIERNKKIIFTRPELTLTKDGNQIKSVEEFCLLPYIKPTLLNEEKITFGYAEDIFDEAYWDNYEIILQNTGKRAISVSFLQVPYKGDANIYFKSELFEWQHSWAKNYYNDERMLPSDLKPQEKIKLIIYYPKSAKELNNEPLDIFIHDEDGNFWIQPYVNFVRETHSDVLSPDAFYMHLHQKINKWYVYDSLYWSGYAGKFFRKDMRKLLEKRKEFCGKKEDEFLQFFCDVNNGITRLRYNLPLD